ncbi:UNVERIFIED_CONTAM: hypothetical protein H355_001419 [Colinus virginianus]|nr:hypothetical protein H355_001419 [Colinus virginianus]
MLHTLLFVQPSTSIGEELHGVCQGTRSTCRKKVQSEGNVHGGTKKYVAGLIIRTLSDPTCVEKEKVYLGKLNVILVQMFSGLDCC